MDVDDSALELAGEGVFQDGIVSRAYHQFDIVYPERLGDRESTRRAVGEVAHSKDLARDPSLLGHVKRRAVPVSANHHHSRRVHRVFSRLDERVQVATPAGDQDANPKSAHSKIWTRRRSDVTISPTTKISPSSSRSAVAALASSTTTIIPSPILNVRHISSSGVNGAR